MNDIRVVITSLPGTWQKILQDGLASHPMVKIVAVAHGCLLAVQLVNEHWPDLLLIDSSIPIDDAAAIVERVKQENPAIACLVIAETTNQRRRMIQAGADFALSSFKYESQIGDILNQFKV
jgi:chemotaxis response regulator CheB